MASWPSAAGYWRASYSSAAMVNGARAHPRGLQNRRAYGHAPGTGGSAAACIQNGSPICPGGTGYAPMGAGGTGYAPTGAAGTGYVIGYAPMGTGGTGYAPMGAGSTGYAPTGAGGAEYVIGYAPMGAGGIWYAPTGAGGTGDAPVGAWVMTVITHSPLTLARAARARPVIFPRDFGRKPCGHFRRALSPGPRFVAGLRE